MTTPQSTPKTALIIGATGSFGAHAVQALIKHGWTIRALARDPASAAEKLGPRTPIAWIKGDAMNGADTLAAAQGAQLIVHAANPARYHNWKGTVLPMLEGSLAAAKAVGARLVFPGNVYNYAPDMGPAIGEDAPQAPATRKGNIRVAMEETLRAATEDGAKVLILRAGDFFGPAAPNSALNWLTLRRRGKLTGVYQPGPADVGHLYAYLPDLAETMARLADEEARLAAFEVFNFRGHYLERNGELAEAIGRVAGRPVPVRPFPWPMVWALSPIVEMFRELYEMRYLWRRPIGLANDKLTQFLGAEPHTALDVALRASLADMGCLEEPARQPAPASRSSSAMAQTM
ncbi:MAG: NAD-dependent epimerase/dehydratase family protein [Caulobacterales bacterium]